MNRIKTISYLILFGIQWQVQTYWLRVKCMWTSEALERGTHISISDEVAMKTLGCRMFIRYLRLTRKFKWHPGNPEAGHPSYKLYFIRSRDKIVVLTTLVHDFLFLSTPTICNQNPFRCFHLNQGMSEWSTSCNRLAYTKVYTDKIYNYGLCSAKVHTFIQP